MFSSQMYELYLDSIEKKMLSSAEIYLLILTFISSYFQLSYLNVYKFLLCILHS